MKITISEEVKHALENNIPVVALESTIIAHGMPYPANMQTALEVEKIIRDNGCIPATVAIIQGEPIVGLNKDQIKYLALAKNCAKVSRRDLPIIVAKKTTGATTVSATMILAAMAGIEVFVTGGVGGVHKGASETFDISADLQELANTNVTVVCAGAKAILDLPLTMEYLETFGVPVIGYKSEDLAAFYSADSGIKLEYSMDSAKEIAEAIHVKRELNLKGGVLISNPIPADKSIPNEVINKYIDEALASAKANNITGKRITPYLLAKICEQTKQESLMANIALVYNNALVGSLIAKELANLNK